MKGTLCTICVIFGGLGQEHPGQGDVVELAQIAEVVVNRQALLTRPAEGFTQRPLRDQHPGPQGRDRPHVGEVVTHIQALRLVEQVECAAQISFSLPYPSHRDTPAVGVLPQPDVLTQLLAPQQMLQWRQPGRCARGGSRSSRRTCPPFPEGPTRPARMRAAMPARRCASRRRDDLACAVCPPWRSRTRRCRPRARPAVAPPCNRHTPGALPPGLRSSRTPAPTARTPTHAGDGLPQAKAPAPAWHAASVPGASPRAKA